MTSPHRLGSALTVFLWQRRQKTERLGGGDAVREERRVGEVGCGGMCRKGGRRNVGCMGGCVCVRVCVCMCVCVCVCVE